MGDPMRSLASGRFLEASILVCHRVQPGTYAELGKSESQRLLALSPR